MFNFLNFINKQEIHLTRLVVFLNMIKKILIISDKIKLMNIFVNINNVRTGVQCFNQFHDLKNHITLSGSSLAGKYFDQVPGEKRPGTVNVKWPFDMRFDSRVHKY